MKICVFGDSVTYAGYIKNSWFNLLKDELESESQEDIEMFNLGINGDTSTDILNRFETEARARTPDQIIFAFGVNDSGYIFSTKEPLVSEDKFRENVQELIHLGSKYTKNITFVGLVIGDDSILKPYPESSKGKSYDRDRAQSYDAMIRELSGNSNCNYIFLFDKLAFEDFSDGLHPNDSGHQKMFAEIRKYIL
jgi:lysophospholipase L1-like esterase